MLGYPERARRRGMEGIEIARTVGHPLSVAVALLGDTVVHWLRRDVERQRLRGEELIALSEQYRFPFFEGLGRASRAAALAAGGANALLAELTEGFGLATGSGSQGGAPALLQFVAESQAAAGRHAEAFGTVETGLAVSAQTG